MGVLSGCREDMRFLQSFVELAKAENLLHEGKPLAPHVEQAFKHLERSLRWK